MKLFYCSSRSHEPLLERYFLPTLPKSFKPHGFFCPSAGNGDFETPGYLECLTFKVRKLLEVLEQCPGETLVLSDVDIVFFRDPVPALENLLRGKVELLLQREGVKIRDVNPGFMACRATPEVRRFYERVLERMKARGDGNDQHATNELLRAGEETVAWDYLPLSFYARTHGWPPPPEAFLYHANYTAGADGVRQKMEQFEEIQWVRENGRAAWLWSCAKRAPGKVWRMVRIGKSV